MKLPLAEEPSCASLCPPPATHPAADTDPDEALARMAKALGHPARIRILRVLTQREGCVCGDLVEALPLAQSTVSEHLRVLKEAGFVRGVLEGPRTCYCVEPLTLVRLRTFLETL